MFKKKGFFIVFEGIEGSGKSYQSKKLFSKLKKINLRVKTTREPGGTKTAEIIRKVILKDYFEKNKSIKFDKYTDTLLYLAARNEHIKKLIKPTLKNKCILICDRFIDSTTAYQVFGKKVSSQFIENIHERILSGIKPNLTFILKVKKKSFMTRLKKRKIKNRYDNFSPSFYLRAQKAFLKIAKNKKNYFIIETSKNSDDAHKKIYQIVAKKLGIKNEY